MLTNCGSGIDFDDPDFGFVEENKDAVKVRRSIDDWSSPWLTTAESLVTGRERSLVASLLE